MNGSKDTKTGLWMLPLEGDGSGISEEGSTIPAPNMTRLTQISNLPKNLPPQHHHQYCTIITIKKKLQKWSTVLSPPAA